MGMSRAGVTPRGKITRGRGALPGRAAAVKRKAVARRAPRFTASIGARRRQCPAAGGVGRGARAPVAARKPRDSKSQRDEEDDEEEEDTDDEDSDDEQREQMEERLLAGDSVDEVKFLRSLDTRAKQSPHLSTTARPVPYQLVVPTYGRWRPVNEMSNKKRHKECTMPFILRHTLGFLATQRVPLRRVTLFVASEEEAQNYRAALRGSAWANVRIQVSVLGNKDNRNFIYSFYPAGTYVVSIDDDVERIAWKFREGITHHVLRSLPPGGLEQIIYDARKRMKQKKAFLWGVNTSQNPRHMRSYGVSTRNGLVNGYLNGFICRPHLASALLRTLADATEDSEFSVRHYNQDGVVLRYRMYAGVTTPYLNRGGLQTKFEATGESITAAERGAARKTEERWAAQELHRLFPRLIGEPRPRRDQKTMEVTFHTNGYPPGEAIKRRMIHPRLHDEDRVRYAANPKVECSVSWKLYESYKKARTVAEARRLGARGIDFAFDSNWGYLQVTHLSTKPSSSECRIVDANVYEPVEDRAVASKHVMVRVKEMSEGHKGIAIPHAALARLVARSPSLQNLADDCWVSMDGPFARVPLEALRILLHWSVTNKLLYARKRTQDVYEALKLCGSVEMARRVKELEAST